MVDYSMSFLLLSTLIIFDGQIGWTILDHLFAFSELLVGPLLHAWLCAGLVYGQTKLNPILLEV